MPSDRTFVSEIATALGMVGESDLGSVIDRRPPELSNLTAANWDDLTALWRSAAYETEFTAGFLNGQAFLAAADALNGRRPRIIEWTGGRRPPGDEVVPSDLRIDHVYLVSCKYLSRILHNPSPARLVEGLLTQAPVEDVRDWYHRVAPVEYQELYEACVPVVDGPSLPARAADLSKAERRRLVLALRTGWPPEAADAYARLCRSVSDTTAARWAARITPRNAEPVLWRLLRIGSAPLLHPRCEPQRIDGAADRHAVGLASQLPPSALGDRTAARWASRGSAGRRHTKSAARRKSASLAATSRFAGVTGASASRPRQRCTWTRRTPRCPAITRCEAPAVGIIAYGLYSFA
jgi:hypothetical protein